MIQDRRHIRINNRIFGSAVLDDLLKATCAQCQVKWKLSVTSDHKVSLLCVQEKNAQQEFVPGVRINILPPIIPEDMFGHIALELEMSGIRNSLFLRKKILKDFEAIINNLRKFFDEHGPYCAFDNQIHSAA